MSICFELTSPLRLHRKPAQGAPYALGVYIGLDHLDQTGLPFFSYINQVRSLNVRAFGWILAADLTGGARERQLMDEELDRMEMEEREPRRASGQFLSERRLAVDAGEL